VLVVDIAKNVVAGAPGGRKVVESRRLGHGYDADKDQSPYVRGLFQKHSAAIAKLGGRIDGRALEIGPGGNLGVALLMAAAGAEHVDCIDTTPWSTGAPKALYEELGATNMSKVEYRAPVDIHKSGLPDASYDVIYSHACFEHFQDPHRAILEIARMLKVGGFTSHQVDLRDHRDFSHPLDHLRYSDLMWRLASSNRGCGGNRWRLADYERVFAAAGFRLDAEVTSSQPVTQEQARHFHRQFRDRPLGEFEPLGVLLVAQKLA
jgi:SAM-dependent methyltransferase